MKHIKEFASSTYAKCCACFVIGLLGEWAILQAHDLWKIVALVGTLVVYSAVLWLWKTE